MVYLIGNMELLGKIHVISYILLGLFVLVSAAHVFFCAKKMTTPRKVTKTFCLLFLGTSVAIAVPNYPLLYIGLFCGMLGDFFLLFDKKKILFCIGAGFFLANHVLFIVQAMVYLSPMDWTVWLGIAVFLLLVYGIGYMLAFWMLRSKFRAIPAGFYAVALISSVATYVLAIMLGHGLWFFISLIGSISFFVSDIMLSYSIFKKGEQKQRHWIMTTYLLGQLLISVGFVLTLLS